VRVPPRLALHSCLSCSVAHQIIDPSEIVPWCLGPFSAQQRTCHRVAASDALSQWPNSPIGLLDGLAMLKIIRSVAEGRKMAKVRKRIAVIALGLGVTVGADLTASAEGAPVPPRVTAPAGQPQTNAPSNSYTVTLTCSNKLAANGGLITFLGNYCVVTSSTPAQASYPTYCASIGGLIGGAAQCPVSAWNETMTITCKTQYGNPSGYYTGTASRASEMDFESISPSQFCTLHGPQCLGIEAEPHVTSFTIRPTATLGCGGP